MLKLDLNKSIQEKKWSDYQKTSKSPKTQFSDNKNSSNKLTFDLPKKRNKFLLPIIGILVSTLLGMAVSYFFIISNSESLGLMTEQEFLANAGKYGLSKKIEEKQEGDVYLNQLLSVIANSENLDVRLITNINEIRQKNPEAAEFYAEAQNGDVLIIFMDIGGAFLLRPSDGRIINMSKFTLR